MECVLVSVIFFTFVELDTWKRTASEVSTIEILVWLHGNTAWLVYNYAVLCL